MNKKQHKQTSKFLSLILRHSPETIDLVLDENGWANVEDILANKKFRINFEDLKEVVKNCDKQRFTLDEDNTKIRANQGHSLKNVDLQFTAIKPPAVLYHGTVDKFMDAIKEVGLKKMSRQHVHLSEEKETAIKVGSRRRKPVILTVDSGEMNNQGIEFYQSDNGVWLTDNVPSNFIDFKEE